jgi:hypothetical protein
VGAKQRNARHLLHCCLIFKRQLQIALGHLRILTRKLVGSDSMTYLDGFQHTAVLCLP